MTRAELVETFAGFPARLGTAAQARAAEWRPIPAGEWGPNEAVRHLIAVEDAVWQTRLAMVAAENDPPWTWTEPGLAPGFDDASLQEILAAFAAARAVTLAAIRALDDAGWARVGTHATYGRLDVAGLLGIAIHHDADHLEDIGR
ncbi:MAG: DinB family protein [Candidatus Limnocylindrales bacterium]